MVGVAAAVAFFAGEGRDARAGVDDDGLTLGGGRADPEVDVVGSVALVEGSHLLLEGSLAVGLGVTQGGGDDVRVGGERMAGLSGTGGQAGVNVDVGELTAATGEVDGVGDERVGDGARFGIR